MRGRIEHTRLMVLARDINARFTLQFRAHTVDVQQRDRIRSFGIVELAEADIQL